MVAFTTIEKRKRPFFQTKGETRALRKAGFIPAIMYGGSEPNESLSVPLKAFAKELTIQGIKARVFQLGGEQRALVKAIQFDRVKDTPIHIDFYRIIPGTQIVVRVPLIFINNEQCPGIKKGGILNIVHHNLELSVSSEDIPSEIIIDLSSLGFGSSLHLKDISLPKGSRPVHINEDATIVTIVAPSGLIEEESSEESASVEPPEESSEEEPEESSEKS